MHVLKMLWPREAAKYIASKAVDVTINMEQLKKCAQMIASCVKENKLDMKSFEQNEVLPYNKGLSQDQLANYMFVVDALNFNFWTSKGIPKFTVTHSGKTRTGYVAMVLALERAIDDGKPMYDPKFYSQLNLDDIKYIFRSDTDSQMPLLEDRVNVLREVGTILLKKFEGNFINVLKIADYKGLKLVDILTTEFPCFNDVHEFEGESVAFFKRAQILVADLAMLYQEKSLGKFSDIDQLTMFADYRVPQALVYFKVMNYSDSLMKKLEGEQLFQNGDREEIEIRGVSLYAGELLVDEINKLLEETGAHINSMKVDYFLWDYRYNHADELEKIPYHKTRCIYY